MYTEIRSERVVAGFDAEAGGRLARLQWRRASGEMLDVVVPMTSGLDGPRWPKAGAYPLIPYSNRIANSTLFFAGRKHALEPHPDASPHTLHGHTHLLPWRSRAEKSSIDLILTCAASAAWPWAFEAGQRFVALDEGLSLELSIRNVDHTPMPAGLGWHPYLVCGTGSRLDHGARSHWPHDSEYLPLGGEKPLPAEWLTSSVPDGQELTGYLGQWCGRCALDRADGVSIELTADPVFDHLVVHRPAGRPYLCVEPTTHVADGFNLAAYGAPGGGIRSLEPGESLKGKVLVSVSEKPAARLVRER